MNRNNDSTPHKKDNIDISPPSSKLKGITIKKAHRKGLPNTNSNPFIITHSTVLGNEDTLAEKKDSHSAKCENTAQSQEYKITLSQARKIALNTIKRAKNRDHNSSDIDD